MIFFVLLRLPLITDVRNISGAWKQENDSEAILSLEIAMMGTVYACCFRKFGQSCAFCKFGQYLQVRPVLASSAITCKFGQYLQVRPVASLAYGYGI